MDTARTLSEQDAEQKSKNEVEDMSSLHVSSSASSLPLHPSKESSDAAQSQAQEENVAQDIAAPSHAVLLVDLNPIFGEVQKTLLAIASTLHRQGLAVHVACPEKSLLASKIQELGYAYIRLPAGDEPSHHVRIKKPGYFTAWRVHFSLRKIRHLCIHVFHPQALIFANRISKKRTTHTPILHSCFVLPKETTQRSVLPKQWHVAHATIVQSSLVQAQLIQAGMAPEKVYVIPMAYACTVEYDVTRFATLPRRCIFLVLEPLFFFDAGQVAKGAERTAANEHKIHDQKERGIDTVLKAMASIWQHPHIPEWEVRIIGEGPAFNAILQEAQNLGVISRLALLGPQEPQVVLPQGHIMLCPSVLPEGNVSSLMAAWYACMPVIASAVPGHLETFAHTDFSQGLVSFAPADAQGLAAAMIQLLQDAKALQSAAQKSASMHDYAQMHRLQKEYIAVYRQVFLQDEQQS